jgi:hypothetical protein
VSDAPYVNIELDGKKKLRYRHNDLADLEVMTGKSFREVLQGTQFHGIRTLLMFGLRWLDPKMSLSKSGDLIQDHWIAKGKTLDQLADVISEALVAGGMLPPEALKPKAPTEDDEGNAQPEAATT